MTHHDTPPTRPDGDKVLAVVKAAAYLHRIHPENANPIDTIDRLVINNSHESEFTERASAGSPSATTGCQMLGGHPRAQEGIRQRLLRVTEHLLHKTDRQWAEPYVETRKLGHRVGIVQKPQKLRVIGTGW